MNPIMMRSAEDDHVPESVLTAVRSREDVMRVKSPPTGHLWDIRPTSATLIPEQQRLVSVLHDGDRLGSVHFQASPFDRCPAFRER